MSDFTTTPSVSTNGHETGFAPAQVASPEPDFGKQATETPEAFRAYAEKSIAQLRDSYTQAREALDEVTAAFEASLDHASKGTSEFNVKVMEIAQRNVNTGFDFARKLAGARTGAEAIELQSSFMRQQFDTLKAQAEEIQQLTARIATDASEPIQQQVSRTIGRYASKV